MPTAIKGAFRDSETTFKSVGRCWMMLDDVFLCILPTSTDPTGTKAWSGSSAEGKNHQEQFSLPVITC
jgi:hypothetical protein